MKMVELNKEKILRQLGFEKDWIIETIACTYNEDNKPNAAPMGAVTKDFEHIILRPFTSTQTFKNLKRIKECTISFVRNPLIFYKFTFRNKDEDLKELLERARNVNAPKLRSGYACLELRVKKFKMESEERARITFDIIDFHDSKIKLKEGYNRAEHALMESIIHATRIEIYLREGKVRLANKLISLINHYSSLCKRVAPNSEYYMAIQEIIKMIQEWKKV